MNQKKRLADADLFYFQHQYNLKRCFKAYTFKGHILKIVLSIIVF